MRQVRSLKSMQQLALSMKRSGTPVVLVPTMGYLHQGHVSLIRRARKSAGHKGKVIVSIYVNPTQFGPKEDFKAYPRDLKKDLSICREEGVDVAFIPTTDSMYPNQPLNGFSTFIIESALSATMEGASRPTHFKGVTTVVCKLFMLTLPDMAIFGAKDYQQAAIIRRMTDNLNLPVSIITAPTVREKDGLAMSSRNAYLTPEQRKQSTILYETIQYARQYVKRQGNKNPRSSTLKASLKKRIQSKPLAKLDYIEIFDADTLKPQPWAAPGSHLAVAVRFGKTRLIDNGRL